MGVTVVWHVQFVGPLVVKLNLCLVYELALWISFAKEGYLVQRYRGTGLDPLSSDRADFVDSI